LVEDVDAAVPADQQRCHVRAAGREAGADGHDRAPGPAVVRGPLDHRVELAGLERAASAWDALNPQVLRGWRVVPGQIHQAGWTRGDEAPVPPVALDRRHDVRAPREGLALVTRAIDPREGMAAAGAHERYVHGAVRRDRDRRVPGPGRAGHD